MVAFFVTTLLAELVNPAYFTSPFAQPNMIERVALNFEKTEN